jgi:uncharacterized membrane protein
MSASRRKDIDRARVREAIEIAETKTSAELVVSLAPFFIGDVWEEARRAFAKLGIWKTRHRNGVLLFVVPSRRRVVVLADEGAVARIDTKVWSDAADVIAEGFARGRGTEALVAAIDQLAQTLAAVFPVGASEVNELPDEPLVGITP